MRKKMKFNTRLNIGLVMIIFFTLITNEISAQAPTIQDCFGAIPVCQNIYSENRVPDGFGTFEETTMFDGCLPIDSNSIYYTFTVNRSGTFGFLITPNFIQDDYDWALFDITNITCDDIANNRSSAVSCNNAGDNVGPSSPDLNCYGPTGATGATNLNEQGVGCYETTYGRGSTPFNDFVNVTKGNIYVLQVANWSRSPNGYTIDFSLGTADIFDSEPPQATNNSNDYICPQSGDGFSSFPIQFNENIKCNSIDESNFTITGPGGPYSFNLVSDECGLGAEYSKNFDLFVQPPLDAGDFVLEMNPNDNYKILDVCDNQSLPLSKPFSYDACALGNVKEIECDDGDPDTIFDKEIVLTCNNDVVCIPCMGRCGKFYDETEQLCENDTIALRTGELVWEAGTYQTILTAVNGCDSVLRTFVEELPRIGLQLEEQYFGFFDEINVLEASVIIDDPIYSWEPSDILSCSDCPNPEVLVGTFLEQIFTVTVTDEDTGCQSAKNINVLITDYNALYMPNAFSPNADGVNDLLSLNYTGALQTAYWVVYNRYGQKIFETNSISDSWNGTFKGIRQPLGVYVYYASATFPNNITLQSKGNITLVR